MTALLVALDLPDPASALAMARAVNPHADGYKVGLELLLAEDPFALEKVVEMGLPVFADAKLHDIPATVERAARQLGRRGARWVTAHASGGDDMMSAAVAGLEDGSEGNGGVLGVTVLTSLDDDSLAAVGVGDAVGQVARLTEIVSNASAEGVICSVQDIVSVRATSSNLLVVTPGIRPRDTSLDDQRRVATVEAAVDAGSDYIVVGRPITGSADPESAAAEISAVCSAMR